MSDYLAVDTSGSHLTVLLKHRGKLFASFEPDAKLAHSLRLMPAIDGLLKSADCSLSDLDAFGVCVGAGSFTGIRIGVSTVKAFCQSLNKPAFEVTAFEALAYNSNGKALAVLDAKHNHYYAAGFDEKKLVLPPCFIDAHKLKELEKEYTLLSSAPLEGFRTKIVGLKEGFAGASEERSQDFIAFEDIKPLYIRKSQAEEGR